MLPAPSLDDCKHMESAAQTEFQQPSIDCSPYDDCAFKQLCPHLNQSQKCCEVWRQTIALHQCALRKSISLTRGLSPGMHTTASQSSTAAEPS